MRDELYHYGVKGMKWGVRKGPPYPIETGISKGTRLNSVSLVPKADDYKRINNKTLYTFNPNDPWDSAVYRGPFAVFKSNYAKKLIYEHQFEVVKDLKMPTKKERVDAFIDLYKNDKVTTAKDLSDTLELLKKYNVHRSKGIDSLQFNDLKTRQEFEKAYEVFNHAIERYNDYASTKKYIDLMSTKYDAMVDDNNQGRIYNNAHDPVIIFRAEQSLKSLDSKLLSVRDIIGNYILVRDELAKEGKNVAL